MKRIVRNGLTFVGGVVYLAAAYVLALCHPQPFFRSAVCYRTIHLYSAAPIPNNAQELLRQAQARIAASPIYTEDIVQHVFVCDTSAQFGFFTNFSFRSSGLTYAYFNRSIFLRPSDLAHNLLINYAGQKVLGDRPFVYYLAHELTHSLTVSYLGLSKYHELPTWLREGYADYVGKGQDSVAGLQAKFQDSSYRTNREYLRCELMVAYLLQVRKVGVQSLLSADYTANFCAAQHFIETAAKDSPTL